MAWIIENGDKESAIIDTDVNSNLMEPVCIVPHDDVTEESEEEVDFNLRLLCHAHELYDKLDELVPILHYLHDKYGDAEALRYIQIMKLIDKIDGEER